MTDKMTDNEIIKALECHIGKDKDRCKHCAYTVYGCDCLGKLLFSLNDLIDRQKAQINGLQDEVIIKTDMLNEQKAEIKELKKFCNDFSETLSNNYKKLEREKWEAVDKAIKEFAEKLNQIVEELMPTLEIPFWKLKINTIAKELTENNDKE